MSVTVRIKQKSLFKKKLNREDIIKLLNLSYGICDENYRLICGEIADHTLIYDENKLARGIDFSMEGTDVVLYLSLPTSFSEIKLFYNAIEIICKELGINKYIRDDANVSLQDNDKFIIYDEKASIDALEDMEEKLKKDKYERFELFGVYNPISIGMKEIKQIDSNLDNLETYLNKIQSMDVYYAAPRVYKVKDKLVGIYVIGTNIPSVVPIKPYIILNQIEGIEEWYVMLKQESTIQYDDFINNVDTSKYYDFNHVIVTLSDNQVDELLNKYIVD